MVHLTQLSELWIIFNAKTYSLVVVAKFFYFLTTNHHWLTLLFETRWPVASNRISSIPKWGTGNVFTSRGGCERHEQFNLVFASLLPQSSIMLSRWVRDHRRTPRWTLPNTIRYSAILAPFWLWIEMYFKKNALQLINSTLPGCYTFFLVNYITCN